ncbi:MAG: TatD family hydrolase [Candidatus Woesearchaeota archaeon]|nr:TatD family hydrolase [Candidatus Woesearchaeota archaeon]
MRFEKDLPQVIERAREADVKIIVQNGVNPNSNRESIKIADQYPDVVRLALGIYPADALELSDEQFDNELKFIEKNRNKIIALGEVGIDYHWVKENEKRKKQFENFEKIIGLSEKMHKPLIVHSRNAEKETFDFLQSFNAKKVIMHCFNADFQTIKEAEDVGYYFTIPTSVVFSKHFRKMATRVSLERIFTETDAPFMSPFPDKKRNEPAFVVEAVKKIAELRKMKIEDVKSQIYENFKVFFK